MRNDRGQVGIVLLLVTVVMLTVGISVVSRTTTDVAITRENEEATRALDAAESAVEKALGDATILDPTTGDVGAQQITVIPEKLTAEFSVGKLNYLETVSSEGEAAVIDLTSATVVSNARLKIEWAKETSCATTPTPASLAITVYNQTGDASTATLRRAYLSPCDRGAGVNDGFTVVPKISSGVYYTSYDLTMLAGDKLVRIRPVYNQTALRVSGNGWALPTQLFKINAQGENSVSKETKAIEVDRTLPKTPSVFDYALFSGTSITN